MSKTKEVKDEIEDETATVTDEINEMLGAISASPTKTPSEDSSENSDDSIEDSKDSEEDEVAKEEKSNEEESGEEDESTSEEEDTTEQKSEELTKDEPDEKDQVIADLRQKLAERETKSTEEETEKKETKEEFTPEVQDFLGDLDIDEVLSDKDKLNTLLNNVYSKGMTDRSAIGESILRDIPNIVRTNVSLMAELEKARDSFYNDNPDLTPFKKVVAAVFEEVSAEQPDKGYTELLDEVGKEARKRLDLHKKATENSEETPPKLPTKKGSRTPKSKPDLSSLESEISEMNETVRR